MNFRRPLEAGEGSFQIAPLIDIVFLLLVFFIVTGALEAQERDTTIDLPKTTAAVTRQREKLDVVVNVTREGRIVLHNQEYSVEKLRLVLAHLRRLGVRDPVHSVSVIIRADGKALHEDVVKVIDACAGAKIKRISFVSVNAGG